MIIYQALACSFPLLGVITFVGQRPIPNITAGLIFLIYLYKICLSNIIPKIEIQQNVIPEVRLKRLIFVLRDGNPVAGLKIFE